ncbi:MAG: trigger factor, partial [Planctomycetota bacterium]
MSEEKDTQQDTQEDTQQDTQEEKGTQEEKDTQEVKNTVTIEEAGPCRKKIIVEVAEEQVNKATDEQYDSLQKEAVVPGFRKGRAPRRLLEKRFGKETAEQVKLKLLAEASESAIKDNELDILQEPDIDYEKIELPESGPLKFEFEIEVRPEFDLPELEGIAVNKTKLEVSNEQVERELKQLQSYSGLWTPRQEGSVEQDDQIIADAILKIEGVEEDEKLDNIEIHVRENGFVGPIPVENLAELLVGAKTGDEKQTTVEVPETFFREEYRGKKAEVTISIKDIKFLKPAEINENFLSGFGVESEAELRERLQDNLQSRLEQQARTEMSEQIYQYLLDNATFDLPMSIVADQSVSILRRQYANLLTRGLPKEKIEEQMEQLQANSDQQAQEQLKTFFVMDKIAKKFEIEVTEEEINGHIAQLAIQRGQRPERMRQDLERDGSLAQFKIQLRDNKCVAKLLESAKITEIEPKKTKKKKAKKKAKKT